MHSKLYSALRSSSTWRIMGRCSALQLAFKYGKYDFWMIYIGKIFITVLYLLYGYSTTVYMTVICMVSSWTCSHLLCHISWNSFTDSCNLLTLVSSLRVWSKSLAAAMKRIAWIPSNTWNRDTTGFRQMQSSIPARIIHLPIPGLPSQFHLKIYN